MNKQLLSFFSFLTLFTVSCSYSWNGLLSMNETQASQDYSNIRTYPGINDRVFQIYYPQNMGFVRSIEVHPNSTLIDFDSEPPQIASEEMCLFVNLEEVGEASGSSEDINRYFMYEGSHRFFIDDITVTETYKISDLVLRLSPDGTTIPGNLTYCFITSDISTGLHGAMFVLEDMIGIEQTFTWTFEIARMSDD